MVHHDRCPLCGSGMIAVEFNCTDHFISKENFDLVRCKTCGFLFTQDSPDENEIGKYYESEEYISHSDTASGLVNKLYHLIRQLMLHRKKRIVKRFTGLKTGKLLDVGSGTGHFAFMMKRSGWNVKGVEISEKARQFSSSAYGLDVIAPHGINELPAESYDCITLWHVLEHFHDPGNYLAELKRVLKLDGLCLVALPNSRSLDAGYYGKFWAAFDVPRHLWHFDPLTFRRFSENSGMEIEYQSVLPFDVFYISVLSEKYMASGIPFIRGMAIAAWFSLLTFFSNNRGSSVIYLLRKKS
jgi:2-polyprenyl-3-methyl-5-hydroxy-6-metoxy-1,4-benzoquinol methylase